MYFPYFRGRQYELIALRELAAGGLMGKSVTPVVEPIKLTSTFNGTLMVYIETKKPISFVINPSVGELINNSDIAETLFSLSRNSSNVILSVLSNERAMSTLTGLSSKGLTASEVISIINKREDLDMYKAIFNSHTPRYTLFPDERQIRRTVKQNKVLFEDKFNKKLRNADYPEDEFFSDDHLSFRDEGYIGFGDYSIIGDEFTDSGFAPRAVAIHIVYFKDGESPNELWIRHFISDNNDDISDVARKFHEAVIKLRNWFRSGNQWQCTSALTTLLEYADAGRYPGLPTIKKLSIMHHLELIGKFLDGGLQR